MAVAANARTHGLSLSIRFHPLAEDDILRAWSSPSAHRLVHHRFAIDCVFCSFGRRDRRGWVLWPATGRSGCGPVR